MPVDGSPLSYREVTVKWANLGRLLLFYLENQRNDADDQNAELKQVGISDHNITPSYVVEEVQRSAASSRKRRDHPPTVTGSAGAYPCTRDIIAYYVEYGNHSILKLEDGSCDLNHRDRPPDFGEDHSSTNSQLKNSRLPCRPNTARYWPGVSLVR